MGGGEFSQFSNLTVGSVGLLPPTGREPIQGSIEGLASWNELGRLHGGLSWPDTKPGLSPILSSNLLLCLVPPPTGPSRPPS